MDSTCSYTILQKYFTQHCGCIITVASGMHVELQSETDYKIDNS